MTPDFSPPFSKQVRDEALGYELSETVNEGFPEGLDSEKLTDLFHRSLDGDARVIPLLKTLIRKHPDYPTLKNYLSVAFHQCGRERQALEVERETLRLHPDYLFARLAEAKRLIAKKDFAKARDALGGTLRLADIHPPEKEIHTSHWNNYYSTVALFYIESGDLLAAQGVIDALDERGLDNGNAKRLTYALMAARMESFQNRMKEDERNEIRVKFAPRPKPTGLAESYEPVHPAMGDLYEFDTDLPQETIDEILALPRETAVQDLIGILNEGSSNAPFYLGDEDFGWEQVHALFLLSEMKAEESIETALRFLGQHPDFLDFFFGDFISWQPFMGIIGGNLPRLSEWMKTPGISDRGKNHILWAVAEIPVKFPDRRGEVVEWLADLLAFYRNSPPANNILDTRLVTNFVDCLATLRATEHEPLIREIYAMGYVSEFMTGPLEDTLPRLAKPLELKRSSGHDGMMPFYRALRRQTNPQPKTNPLLESSPFTGHHPQPTEAKPNAGRNDPCPCGSGKKYKKCCMKK